MNTGELYLFAEEQRVSVESGDIPNTVVAPNSTDLALEAEDRTSIPLLDVKSML